MKRILFDGAYGIESFGDDAPLVVMSQMLRERIENIEFAVVTRHPDEKHYAKLNVREIPGIEYQTKTDSLGKWFRGFNPGDNTADLCALYEEIAKSDILILGAGNFLVDYTIDILKGHIPRFVIMSLMAKMTGTPVMWYGISVGPLKTKLGRDLSRLSAMLASTITVRDNKSIQELNNIGIKRQDIIQLPDATYNFTLPPNDHARRLKTWANAHKEGKGVLSVSIRSLPEGCGISNEKYIEVLASAIDRIIEKKNYNILFVPQCTYTHGNPEEDDRFVAGRIIEKMNHKANAFSVTEDIDVIDCISLYTNSVAAICTRLHGNVFAALNEVPVIGLNYNPKVSEFFKYIGFDELVIEMHELTEKTIISKFDELEKVSQYFIKKTKQQFLIGKNEIEKYADIAASTIDSKICF